MKKFVETMIMICLVTILSMFVATEKMNTGSGESFTTGIVVSKDLHGHHGERSLVVRCGQESYEVMTSTDLYYKVEKGDVVGVKIIGGIPAYAIPYRRVRYDE